MFAHSEAGPAKKYKASQNWSKVGLLVGMVKGGLILLNLVALFSPIFIFAGHSVK